METMCSSHYPLYRDIPLYEVHQIGRATAGGLFQLLPGVYWEWKLSLLSRVPTHVWQVIVVSDYGHGCNQASDLA